MTGVDRRLPGGEQREQVRLWALQVKGDLVVAAGRDLVEIAIPGLAGIDPEFLARLAGQCVPGAFDVGGGERFTVVPFDTLMQMEGQCDPGLVPGPVAGKVGDDRGE